MSDVSVNYFVKLSCLEYSVKLQIRMSHINMSHCRENRKIHEIFCWLKLTPYANWIESAFRSDFIIHVNDWLAIPLACQTTTVSDRWLRGISFSEPQESDRIGAKRDCWMTGVVDTPPPPFTVVIDEEGRMNSPTIAPPATLPWRTSPRNGTLLDTVTGINFN